MRCLPFDRSEPKFKAAVCQGLAESTHDSLIWYILFKIVISCNSNYFLSSGEILPGTEKHPTFSGTGIVWRHPMSFMLRYVKNRHRACATCPQIVWLLLCPLQAGSVHIKQSSVMAWKGKGYKQAESVVTSFDSDSCIQ